MALSPQKLETMTSLPIEKKWIMVCQQNEKRKAKESSTEIGVLKNQTLIRDPKKHIEFLNTTPPINQLIKEVQALEVGLRSEAFR